MHEDSFNCYNSVREVKEMNQNLDSKETIKLQTLEKGINIVNQLRFNSRRQHNLLPTRCMFKYQLKTQCTRVAKKLNFKRETQCKI